MKKDAKLLKPLLIIAVLTNSSCALGMGQRRDSCKPPVIPTRPVDYMCISDELGNGQCYDPVTEKWTVKSMKNYICRDPRDDSNNEKWIKDVLRAIGK